MISFSPTTKFTMQKIKYHVSRGAYFWTNFQIKGLDRAEKKVEELKKIYEEVTDEKEEVQNAYDRETKHSINKEKQAEWLKKIQEMLDEYADYADY